MLLQLKINNYALIDSVEIDFFKGFNSITGETGAGKSILIGALSLLLGSRADSQVIFDLNRKCIVEGFFDIDHYGLRDFFQENDLDFQEVTILRREIAPGGKSRAFINDTPVTLNTLKELAVRIIDIHSQHSTYELSSTQTYQLFIDDFAGNHSLLAEYRSAYNDMMQIKQRLHDLREQEKNAAAEKDYLQYLDNELTAAQLHDGELEILEHELKVLSHATELKSILSQSHQLLDAGDQNIYDRLQVVMHLLSKGAQWHEKIGSLSFRVEAVQIEISDMVREIVSISDQINDDPEKLDAVTKRINLINSLLQKHRVKTTGELIETGQKLKRQLQQLDTLSEEIDTLEKSYNDSVAKVNLLSATLSEKRHLVLWHFENEVKQYLSDLGMPDAVFNVVSSSLSEPSYNGSDRFDFLFSATNGNVARPLSDVASGGELSRFMLAVKYTISKRKQLATIILDEIDSGISGAIAGKMGALMRQMAETMQVITITHLPQIAAKAQAQFLVFKVNETGHVRSQIKPVYGEERVLEIAKMLSDHKITESALQKARELLDS